MLRPIAVVAALALCACSLIVRNKLDETKSGDGSVSDGRPRDRGKGGEKKPTDSMVTDGARRDGGGGLLKVEGEQPVPQPQPYFIIGERVLLSGRPEVAQAKVAVLEATNPSQKVVVGVTPYTDPSKAVVFIPPLAPEGPVTVTLYGNNRAPLGNPPPQAQITIERVVLVGGGSIDTAQGLSASSFTKLFEIPLGASLAGAGGWPPVLSPSGRYLLVQTSGTAGKLDVKLVDVVLKQVVSLKTAGAAPVGDPGFCPHSFQPAGYIVAAASLPAVFVYQPESTLSLVDPTGGLRSISIASALTGAPLPPADGTGLRQVLWAPGSTTGNPKILPVLAALRPDGHQIVQVLGGSQVMVNMPPIGTGCTACGTGGCCEYLQLTSVTPPTPGGMPVFVTLAKTTTGPYQVGAFDASGKLLMPPVDLVFSGAATPATVQSIAGLPGTTLVGLSLANSPLQGQLPLVAWNPQAKQLSLGLFTHPVNPPSILESPALLYHEQALVISPKGPGDAQQRVSVFDKSAATSPFPGQPYLSFKQAVHHPARQRIFIVTAGPVKRELSMATYDSTPPPSTYDQLPLDPGIVLQP